MSRSRSIPKQIAVAVLAVLLGVAAGTVAPPAHANTFVVGRGASTAELRRPGVHIDAWGSRTLSASAQRPQSTVLFWTEVTRAKAPHRWWWKTYTSWCATGRCSPPVLALKSRRGARRTSPNTVTPWQIALNADPTRDRAVVKAGIRWGSRWAITGRTRLIAKGPTENVWNGGYTGITHTRDGQDWLSWNDDDMRIRISRARNGHRLGGPVIARGSRARVRQINGRWVLLWFGQTDDGDLEFPANITSAPTIAGLRTSTRTRLVSRAVDSLLTLLGPADGPLLAVWQSDLQPDLARPVRGAWIDSTGTLGAPQVLDADFLDAVYLRSITAPPGNLVLCPWNLAAPLGGTVQLQPGTCDDSQVRPVRMK